MERKTITNTAKCIISIWNIALFAAVWVSYYNSFTFDHYRLYGGIVSCLIYAIIYLAMCNLYKAFRIASTNIGEIVFAQVIAFGIADVILYAECCLINNNIISVMPGGMAAMLQILGTACIVKYTKNYFSTHVAPKKTLVVYGEGVSLEETEAFTGRLLKKYDHLFAITYIEKEDVSEITMDKRFFGSDVVILYEVSAKRREHFMKKCMEARKRFYFTPRIEDLVCQGSEYKQLLDTPLMKYEYSYDHVKEYGCKRVMDITFSILFLFICSPIFLLTSIAIKLEDHGSVFYHQKRCTRDGKVFEIFKFRSMIMDAEKNGAKPCVGNDSRITRVGSFIRKYRIDELPQLINILRGEMSFVGPRPERIEHVEKYTAELPDFAYRLRVKAGLTGYAQIYGKYNTSAYDKLRWDLMYIENQSFLLDLKIIMLTFRTLFQAESTEGFDNPHILAGDEEGQGENTDCQMKEQRVK